MTTRRRVYLCLELDERASETFCASSDATVVMNHLGFTGDQYMPVLEDGVEQWDLGGSKLMIDPPVLCALCDAELPEEF